MKIIYVAIFPIFASQTGSVKHICIYMKIEGVGICNFINLRISCSRNQEILFVISKKEPCISSQAINDGTYLNFLDFVDKINIESVRA